MPFSPFAFALWTLIMTALVVALVLAHLPADLRSLWPDLVIGILILTGVTVAVPTAAAFPLWGQGLLLAAICWGIRRMRQHAQVSPPAPRLEPEAVDEVDEDDIFHYFEFEEANP